jgi:hypothetical protein
LGTGKNISIYFLFGDSMEDDVPTAYVGEAEKFLSG